MIKQKNCFLRGSFCLMDKLILIKSEKVEAFDMGHPGQFAIGGRVRGLKKSFGQIALVQEQRLSV